MARVQPGVDFRILEGTMYALQLQSFCLQAHRKQPLEMGSLEKQPYGGGSHLPHTTAGEPVSFPLVGQMEIVLADGEVN